MSGKAQAPSAAISSATILLPQWAENAILNSCQSESWYQLLYGINEKIQSNISNYGLPVFSDLPESEQAALVEKEFHEVPLSYVFFIDYTSWLRSQGIILKLC